MRTEIQQFVQDMYSCRQSSKHIVSLVTTIAQYCGDRQSMHSHCAYEGGPHIDLCLEAFAP